jgi:hypothetical protein
LLVPLLLLLLAGSCWLDLRGSWARSSSKQLLRLLRLWCGSSPMCGAIYCCRSSGSFCILLVRRLLLHMQPLLLLAV